MQKITKQIKTETLKGKAIWLPELKRVSFFTNYGDYEFNLTHNEHFEFGILFGTFIEQTTLRMYNEKLLQKRIY